VVPINHMVVVSPATIGEASGSRSPRFIAFLQHLPMLRPHRREFSADEMRRSLEVIIGYSAQQGLIPRAFAVDELFDDVTRALA